MIESYVRSKGEDSTPAEKEPPLLMKHKRRSARNWMVALCNRILQVITTTTTRVGLPSLKACDKAKLRAEVRKINKAVKRIQTHNMIQLSSLLYAASYDTTQKMGLLKETRGSRSEEPFCNRNLEKRPE